MSDNMLKDSIEMSASIRKFQIAPIQDKISGKQLGW